MTFLGRTNNQRPNNDPGPCGRHLINGLAKSCDYLHHGMRAKSVDADAFVAKGRLLPNVQAQ
jgi:hypothetical protein